MFPSITCVIAIALIVVSFQRVPANPIRNSGIISGTLTEFHGICYQQNAPTVGMPISGTWFYDYSRGEPDWAVSISIDGVFGFGAGGEHEVFGYYSSRALLGRLTTMAFPWK